MRYHYQTKTNTICTYGHVYICDHPLYSKCTLYRHNRYGLAVIQQRFNAKNKSTYWEDIDAFLVDDIYKHPKFKDYFEKMSKVPINGLYPTVTVRQIMWALKMKPLKKMMWETTFDHTPI